VEERLIDRYTRCAYQKGEDRTRTPSTHRGSDVEAIPDLRASVPKELDSVEEADLAGDLERGEIMVAHLVDVGTTAFDQKAQEFEALLARDAGGDV
jgi:hypothetical protein